MSTVIDGPFREFVEASKRESKLYHATRIVLDLDRQDLHDGHPRVSWGSGFDVKKGWEEFLDQEVFETREYERSNGWQQSCYYGSSERMNEYTILASRSLPLATPGFVDFDRPTEVHHLDRDTWTFGLYDLAVSFRKELGFDLFGKQPYSTTIAAPTELRWIFSRSDSVPEFETALDTFRQDYFKVMSREPRFVFATLLVDVFAASSFAIRQVLENQWFWYDALDALDEFDQLPEIETTVASDAKTKPGRGGQNLERNKWIYEKCCEGIQHKRILGLLRELAAQITLQRSEPS